MFCFCVDLNLSEVQRTLVNTGLETWIIRIPLKIPINKVSLLFRSNSFNFFSERQENETLTSQRFIFQSFHFERKIFRIFLISLNFESKQHESKTLTSSPDKKQLTLAPKQILQGHTLTHTHTQAVNENEEKKTYSL